MGKSLIVGTSLLAMTSAAQAEPVTLTSGQMDAVTAGALTINLNLNITTQIAVPTAVSIAVCGVCGRGALPRAVATAGGSNFNTTFRF